MIVECLKDKLKQAVGQLEKITSKNLSLPILESILIETRDKKLILKSTNLDVGIEIQISAKIEKNGAVAVPASILSNFLNVAPDNQNIKIEVIGGNMSISSKRGTTLIKGYQVEDFPIIPRVEKELSFMINSSFLVQGIKSVSYSASMSDMKPEISSVYFYGESNSITFVSTDSFRLAEKKFDVPGISEHFSTIIPYKNANEIARIFDGSDDVLEVGFNKNQIYISSEDIYITSRLVGGIFPDYKQIIPTSRKTEIIALKKDLLEAIRLSNIFSDKFNQIDMKVIPEDKMFEIMSKNQDKGENTAKLEAVIDGEDVSISLNAKYLFDCLSFIGQDSVTIQFNGSNKPIVIRGVGDNSFTYLVMPMNKQ